VSAECRETEPRVNTASCGMGPWVSVVVRAFLVPQAKVRWEKGRRGCRPSESALFMGSNRANLGFQSLGVPQVWRRE
jgi:hypothetical protein